jgi:hypothetical protein
MERCKVRVQLGSHIHILDNVKECEGTSPCIPKWSWSPYEVLNFQIVIKGSKFIVLKISLYH